jgi:hypothetical protein
MENYVSIRILSNKRFFKITDEKQLKEIIFQFGGLTQLNNEFYSYTKEMSYFDLETFENINSIKFYVVITKDFHKILELLDREQNTKVECKGYYMLKNGSIAYDDICMVEFNRYIPLKFLLYVAKQHNKLLQQESTAIEINNTYMILL